MKNYHIHKINIEINFDTPEMSENVRSWIWLKDVDYFGGF